MRDYALELAAAAQGVNAKRNILREYLQAYLLRLASDQGLFRQAAFVGGTALRFLYGLPRFSEDIDLCLVKGPRSARPPARGLPPRAGTAPDSPGKPGASSAVKKRGFSLEEFVKKTKQELVLAGYQISVNLKEEKTVQRATVRFEDLLFAAGISPLRSEKLSIRLEIDRNPPKGAKVRTEIVHKFFPMAFLTYDLPSLFAGKLAALLSRPYTKGRDFYDLGWYLSRWRGLTPNIRLLQNALKQMSWKKAYPTQKSWREVIAKKIDRTDWKQVRSDVERFLDRPSDMNVFKQENVLKLVLGKE